MLLVGPEVRAVRPELMVELGRTARLGCEVRGYPAPRIAWVREGSGEVGAMREYKVIRV